MKKAQSSNNFHYNKSLRHLARKNRSNMTKSAACMWKYLLKNRQMFGFQFRRERPILNYIVDFVCFELMLIIEVDGLTHDSPHAAMMDQLRDQSLASVGFTTLRFSSAAVLRDLLGVSEEISTWIEKSGIPPPDPRQRAGSFTSLNNIY